jgi:hypothetical protein
MYVFGISWKKIRTILIEEMHTKKFHEASCDKWISKSTDPFEKLSYHQILFWGKTGIGPFDQFPNFFKSELENQMRSKCHTTSFDYTKVYYGGSVDDIDYVCFGDDDFDAICSSNSVDVDTWKLDWVSSLMKPKRPEAYYTGEESVPVIFEPDS